MLLYMHDDITYYSLLLLFRSRHVFYCIVKRKSKNINFKIVLKFKTVLLNLKIISLQ